MNSFVMYMISLNFKLTKIDNNGKCNFIHMILLVKIVFLKFKNIHNYRIFIEVPKNYEVKNHNFQYSTKNLKIHCNHFNSLFIHELLK